MKLSLNQNQKRKELIFTLDELKSNSEYFKNLLHTILKYQNLFEYNDWEMTCVYFTLFLNKARKDNYILPKNRKPPLNIDHQKTFLDLIERGDLDEKIILKLKDRPLKSLFSDLAFKGVSQSALNAMQFWYDHPNRIKLLYHIPDPHELFQYQVNGVRVVTLIIDPRKIDTYILKKRDALSFLLHDLEHADHFFSHPLKMIGQIGFYQSIQNYRKEKWIVDLLASDPTFQQAFYYIISDMNAYVVHMLKCLKSAFDKAQQLNSFYLWHNEIYNQNQELLECLSALNSQSSNAKTEEKLALFYEDLGREIEDKNKADQKYSSAGY